MSKQRPLFLIVVLLLLMIAVLPAAAQDYDPNAVLPRPTNPASATRNLEGYLIVATDNLFLRSGDGPQYTPLAILDGGTRLVPLGQNGLDELWWYVRVGTFSGWVTNQFVVVRGDLSDIPVVEVDGTILPPTLYMGAANQIYSRPGSIRVLCNATAGQFYIVTARDADAENWYRIELTCDGLPVEGWVQADRVLYRNPGGVIVPVVGS